MSLSRQRGGGGTELEAGLGMLEKQLTCPICLELLQKPVVILPCQHNLCRKCANDLYQPSLFQARTTMTVNSGRFRCPSCRHEVILDRHGVFGLQRNLLVENIIDVYKQEVGSDATRPLPASPSTPAQITCSEHDGEKVNIYCVTCQLPTCSLCKVFGQHQSCQVQTLDHVLQHKKDELREGVASLVEVNQKVQVLIDELEETCRSIEENCKTHKQNVCDKFSRMFSILDERHKAMTERISSEEEEKTGRAQLLACCYGDSMAANRKLVEKARSSMEDPDMAAFVQNSKELIAKVQAAALFSPAEMLKAGQEEMTRYTFNFSQQESAARSVDFTRGDVHLNDEDSPAEASEPAEHSQSSEPSEPAEASEPADELHQESLGLPDLLIQNLVGREEEVPEPVVLPAESEQTAPEDPEDSEWTEQESGLIKEEVEECAAEEGQTSPINTQQREDGGAVSQADDWTEGQKEAGSADVLLYPGWYRSRMKPLPQAGEAEEVTDRQDMQDSMLDPETRLPEDSSLPPQKQPRPLSPQLHPPFMPPPLLQFQEPALPEMGGDGNVGTEEDDEDTQGWVCLSDEGSDPVEDVTPIPAEEHHFGPEEETLGLTKEKLSDSSEGDVAPNESHKVEASDEEESVTSFDSLQAITLFFYLVAFLVLLQKFWSYIGCFICT
ncbi:tripartite motif-containing protein 54-like isoform X2 [Dunckerocampus dactyliophorus]|uniref:tripartite motif-containing protein 54-like isoform X2 n=1 Tax=Dunckerocampus dactyliophorus TaxID=161453 RepID=UPI0024051D58|nr:tripartite motif-containing protein 54-like isoform X2 [Dunckerocampus dactyliophorus]XP_054644062.1 tripartite motif-containing protein 54-like isoform X2 [Dunckerocampus dactyliophorus]